VQVHGASGALGRELVRALLAAGHPPAALALFARSAHRLAWRGTELLVSAAGGETAPAELAFLCTPPAGARALAARLVAAGTRVVDLTGTHSAAPEIPLVAGELGARAVGAFTALLAVPDPATVLAARPLAALEAGGAPVQRISLTLLASAASGGASGILAWRRELARAAAAGSAPGAWAGGELLDQILSGPEEAALERRLAGELRRLLGRPELPVAATCVRAGLERVDALGLEVDLAAPLDAATATELLAAAPGLAVAGDELRASSAVGREEVQVGRIRTGSAGRGSLCFFAVGDRLRAGAVPTALRAAALLPWA